MVVILNNKTLLALNIPAMVEINHQFSRHHKHIRLNNPHRLRHQNNLIKKFSRQPRKRRIVMEVVATHQGSQQNQRRRQPLQPPAIDFKRSKRKHQWSPQILFRLKLKQLPPNRFEPQWICIIKNFRMTEEQLPQPDHRHYPLPYLQMEFRLHHNSSQRPKNLLAVANNITTCSSNPLMSIYWN